MSIARTFRRAREHIDIDILCAHNKCVRITFDSAKSERNAVERGLPFERAADFDFQSAKFWIDERRDYSEQRIVAIGYLGDRLHVIVFTPTARGIRVISLRRASAREGAKHGFAKARDQ